MITGILLTLNVDRNRLNLGDFSESLNCDNWNWNDENRNENLWAFALMVQ